MARLLGPDETSRAVYTVVGGTWRSAAGLTATIYSNAGGTVLADVLTEGGAAVPGSTFTVDSYSRLPLFQFPDGATTVYASINSGPTVAVYANSGGGGTSTEYVDTAVATVGMLNRSGVAATQRLQWLITRAVEDVSVVLVGDSTGVGNSAWFRVLVGLVAPSWPTHTVRYRDWNDTTGVYNSATTVQTGSGSRIVDFYNASVASTNTAHAIAQYFDTRVAAIQPTVLVVSHGHNEGISSTTRDRSIAAMLTLTETITAACPDTEIILVGQNPETNNTNIDRAVGWYSTIAEMRGYGFMSTTQAFRDDARWALGTGGGGIMTDTIHPNNAGYTLWAQTLAPYFTTRQAGDPPGVSQQVSGFNTYRQNLLTNGEFSLYTATPGAPDGWTATGSPTVTRDTSTVEDAVKGWSVKIVGSGSAAGDINQAVPISAVAGKVVTLLARIYVPAASPTTSGILSIEDSAGTTSTNNNTYGRDGWRWAAVTRRIAASATSCTVRIYGVNAAAAGTAYVDRVALVYGKLPTNFFTVSRQRLVGTNLAAGYTAVSNTTSDTTVASLDIPAGAVAAGDVMVFECGGTLLNNSGGSVNHTFRLKVGATTVLTTPALSISTNASDREWHLRATIMFPTTSTQKVSGLFTYALPDTANWGGGGGGGTAPGYGTAAESTTTAVTVAFTLQPGTASALQSMQATWATLTRL